MDLLEIIKRVDEAQGNILYKNGVYIATKLSKESEYKIKEYQEKYLSQYDCNNELHCTLIYSKKPLNKDVLTKEYKYKGIFKDFQLFGPENDTLVIELNSPEMTKRNNELKDEYGFISDFSDYKPHVTLSYDCKDIYLKTLPKIDFDIYLEDEYIEPLNTEWSSNGN